jgi:hypothetical protein
MLGRPPIVLRRAAASSASTREAAPTVFGALAALALYLVVGVLPILWLFLALKVCVYPLDMMR